MAEIGRRVDTGVAGPLHHLLKGPELLLHRSLRTTGGQPQLVWRRAVRKTGPEWARPCQLLTGCSILPIDHSIRSLRFRSRARGE